MFESNTLKNHFETSATIQTKSLVLAEWNLNMPDNIFKLGNYRYRPQEANSQFLALLNTFDSADTGLFYTGATDADVVIDGGVDDDEIPQLFKLPKEKLKLLYSLEDCIKPFRPRSGINKAVMFRGKKLSNSGSELARRPRYYMASRYDQFKYFTSYRTEDGIERGIAKNISTVTAPGTNYYIDDTAPFVVYKNNVPANRIIIKMQTNVGDIDLGPFVNGTSSSPDPFFGNNNKTTPTRWKVQYLDGNNWTDAYVFNENDLREDGTQIIKHDGYVELQYGLKNIPNSFKDTFIFAQTLSSTALLPDQSVNGYAYLVIENDEEVGQFYVWNSTTNQYESFTPDYGWFLGNEEINHKTTFVQDLTNPAYFKQNNSNIIVYREFQNIRGIRIVVERMNKLDSTFDLIEMSPRLVVDISDKVIEYNIKKILSDLGSSALPVGQLLASTGSLLLFDDDQAFNDNNPLSIVKNYIRKNIKFNFYEKILNVEGFDYWVPIKTLYSEGFPQADVTAGTLELQLRDFYFFLESMPAPRMLVTEVSFSYAISLLLDYIGFTNYSFYREENETESIIPFFFIAPDQTVAEVLNQLAVATQSAMFFDEYNNFIVMSKNYMLSTSRLANITLSGSNNQTKDGIIENQTSGTLPNILAIASQDKKVYNNGKINYTSRYIQRSYGSIRQASMIDKEKTWIYKPSLLWEVSGTDSIKTINEVASKQGKYILGAMPLNADLSSVAPTVINHTLRNNIIDLGENVYWLTRYQGYFYSNGEVIKYDAAEFNITGVGNVWITSNQEYQNYFKSLPFNGKIYPTGLVRIYSVPYYETVDGVTRLQNGAVSEHGRGQFGTTITEHSAGVNSYWLNNDNVKGCDMQAQFLFSTQLAEDIGYPTTTLGAAGINNEKARQTSRNGTIKNFMSSGYLTETENINKLSTESGTIQSSALVMNGPSFTVTENPINLVSYVYKPLYNTGSNNLSSPNIEDSSPVIATESSYKHFGTRLRIIGKIENNENRGQTPIGSVTYYQVPGAQPDKNVSIGGGSGGLAVLLNPETNNGYYFEIIALTENNVNSYLNLNDQGESNIQINNVVFYKVKKEASNNNAIPIKLWGGLAKIIVDDGRFTGQYRFAAEENPTVYDLEIEYEDIGKTRRFYLYINNKMVQIVDDPDPLPIYNNMALFVRGSSKCMFENIYALSPNFAQNSNVLLPETPSIANNQINQLEKINNKPNVFGNNLNNINESFRKYAISGTVQSKYLSGISSQQPPEWIMYFEEFGSIMRECAYFDIRYDRAYPALYAQISPTFNKIKGYNISGFYADSYGAEFLIFNATDTALNLDETTGNYLRIQGITFTQDTTHELTVDDYFKKKANFASPQLVGLTTSISPLVEKQKFDNIKLSRMIYGNNEFSLETPYIQTQDEAENLMGWLINKLMEPKKSIGVNIFPIPTLQLGDMVTLDYKNFDDLDLVAKSTDKFVIYNIEYTRNNQGPAMTLYLSEV